MRVAERVGYPILVRPSYVLGGQGMRIAINADEVAEYVDNVLHLFPDNEILLDLFLENAIEVDCDALYDGHDFHICGILQHIEPAGVHSGDSNAVLPPYSLSEETQETIRRATPATSPAASRSAASSTSSSPSRTGSVYVIEANPRASRTVPFIAKATASRSSRSPPRSCSASGWRRSATPASWRASSRATP
jgi:carbamoyl-phosphate synthase large subunit